MTLSPDRIAYLELRATTDCLLAFQVGDQVEFYDRHAETVASVCGLPLSTQEVGPNERPVAACAIAFQVFTDQPGKTLVRFSGGAADQYEALVKSHPVAVACKGEDPDGSPFWEIMYEARPRLDRPQMRAVD